MLALPSLRRPALWLDSAGPGWAALLARLCSPCLACVTLPKDWVRLGQLGRDLARFGSPLLACYHGSAGPGWAGLGSTRLALPRPASPCHVAELGWAPAGLGLGLAHRHHLALIGVLAKTCQPLHEDLLANRIPEL